MKKIYTSALLMSLSVFTIGQTQLPNTSFENWETVPYESTSYDQPVSWNPGNICASFGENANCSVSGTQTSTANTGNSAVYIIDDGFLGLNLLNYDFTDKPNSLELKVKKGLNTGDIAEIQVYLHDGDILGNANTIAEGNAELSGTSTDYETVTVNIDYSSKTESFEHITIIISVTESEDQLVSVARISQSNIIVDDLKLNYDTSVGLFNSPKKQEINISPNPASDVLNFNEELKQFDIISANGEIIKTGNNVDRINISSLSQGMYFIKGTNSEGEVITSRFVKQ